MDTKEPQITPATKKLVKKIHKPVTMVVSENKCLFFAVEPASETPYAILKIFINRENCQYYIDNHRSNNPLRA